MMKLLVMVTVDYRFWELTTSYEEGIRLVNVIFPLDLAMSTFFLSPLVGTFRGGGDIMVVSGNVNCRKTSLISNFISYGTFLRRC